jgi:hypothetical protein
MVGEQERECDDGKGTYRESRKGPSCGEHSRPITDKTTQVLHCHPVGSGVAGKTN